MQETWVQSLGQDDLLEKRMAHHSSILAWRILQAEESRGLQSMGLQRVSHLSTRWHVKVYDWVTNTFTYYLVDKWTNQCYLIDIHYNTIRRRQWYPTPVLLPGKSHGWRRLIGCGPWGREQLDTTEQLHFHFSLWCTGDGTGTHSSVLAWRIPGTGSLVGCHLWGRTESDMTEAT